MAGYRDFSKSNNALDAEAANRFPASVLARKLKVRTAAIKALMEPREWHHSSKHYNEVDYYDGDLLLSLAAGVADLYETDEIETATTLLAALRAWRPPAKNVKRWCGCTVKWLEWSGTRNRPKATENTADNCSVEWRGGKFCTVTFPQGGTMRKGTETNGFEVRDSEGRRVYFN